ncbi:hypothetical protein [Microcystis phage Mel-JY33]
MTMTRRQKREAQQQRADMQAVLGTPEGRRVIAWVLDRCGLLAPNLRADPIHEGRRVVGLDIVSAMEVIDPLILPRILAEEITRKQRDASEQPEELSDED